MRWPHALPNARQRRPQNAPPKRSPAQPPKQCTPRTPAAAASASRCSKCGRATRARMPVRGDFLNGHQICHGGLVFTLADSTFAFACNSYNINTVAAGCSIEFLRPVAGGDVLTAEATEQTLNGRHGIYDIRVTNRAGETVAMFRGKSTQIKGTVIPVDR
ncbi:hydroxyphenylacetyl-CoA thioesterase PaaI [Burkholderia mallei]|uniref:Hydroxyphenylacetyl-CoA thioesterase PaaI n=2 Tax=Burkholderia mallei TaxID=13373 RepID=A0AAX1XF21_BURML|nr:hypothetical protein BMAA0539.1 [Burkholderia mallei ATCC 23344]RKN93352.1 hydroxyphenylacetyl-CoA thioesterase PaaI [Burkholderia mallei]RKN96229.1 hydroxyphenylacetyl-CoA thioesterase PaaI [Burkholderia mallei]RKN97698.1 hydroxyphenylacetyl-CoA thioesterase PaaI [Burkholderia mallei]RKO11675.1 hydroxyphenylacetyl-CoA thioesterase PaaI [Burkholderia mallei]